MIRRKHMKSEGKTFTDRGTTRNVKCQWDRKASITEA